MRIARLGWIQRVRMTRLTPRGIWLQSTSTSLVVAALLCLAALNVIQRASWSEVEDGVLWRNHDGEVVAVEVARDTAAARAGIHSGDILQAINGKDVETVADRKSTRLKSSHIPLSR